MWVNPTWPAQPTINLFNPTRPQKLTIYGPDISWIVHCTAGRNNQATYKQDKRQREGWAIAGSTSVVLTFIFVVNNNAWDENTMAIHVLQVASLGHPPTHPSSCRASSPWDHSLLENAASSSSSKISLLIACVLTQPLLSFSPSTLHIPIPHFPGIHSGRFVYWNQHFHWFISLF